MIKYLVICYPETNNAPFTLRAFINGMFNLKTKFLKIILIKNVIALCPPPKIQYFHEAIHEAIFN